MGDNDDSPYDEIVSETTKTNDGLYCHTTSSEVRDIPGGSAPSGVAILHDGNILDGNPSDDGPSRQAGLTSGKETSKIPEHTSASRDSELPEGGNDRRGQGTHEGLREGRSQPGHADGVCAGPATIGCGPLVAQQRLCCGGENGDCGDKRKGGWTHGTVHPVRTSLQGRTTVETSNREASGGREAISGGSQGGCKHANCLSRSRDGCEVAPTRRADTHGHDGGAGRTTAFVFQACLPGNAIQISDAWPSSRVGGGLPTTGGDENHGFVHRMGRLRSEHLQSRWQFKLGHSSGHYPLHVKKVRQITLTQRTELLRHFSLDPENLFAYTCGLLLASRWPQLDELKSFRLLPLADTQVLETAGLIEPFEAHIPVNCGTFTVDEIEKERRRWIVHPEQFNQWCPSTVQIPTQEEVMKRVAFFRYARCCDFKAYYHQFGLTQNEVNFVIGTELGRRRLKCLPTGAAICPLIAQTFSLAIVKLMRDMLGEIHSSTIAADVYLDNVRLLGNDLERLDEAVRVFFRAANALRVEINETMEEVLGGDPEKYIFLGLQFDHACATTCLGPKTLSKLRLLKRELEEAPTTIDSDAKTAEVRVTDWSCARALSAFGLLQHAATTNGTPRARAYYVFKFLRRRVGTQLEAPAHVWPSCLPAWQWWVNEELSAPPRIHSAEPRKDLREITLFTDASTKGAGVVWFAEGRMFSFGRRWREHERSLHINVLEAKAVLLGLEKVEECIGICRLHLNIDNTSVLWCMRKTWSRGFALNSAIYSIVTHPLFARVETLEYIASDANPADKPSRE